VKGLKIRTPPEIQLQSAMEALGGVVTKIAFPELYMALAQGVVDAQENPIAVIYHNKFYEVQKNLAITGHVYNNMVHVISAKTWAKLSADQKKIFQEEKELEDKERILREIEDEIGKRHEKLELLKKSMGVDRTQNTKIIESMMEAHAAQAQVFKSSGLPAFLGKGRPMPAKRRIQSARKFLNLSTAVLGSGHSAVSRSLYVPASNAPLFGVMIVFHVKTRSSHVKSVPSCHLALRSL
jgi:hypothetical protein